MYREVRRADSASRAPGDGPARDLIGAGRPDGATPWAATYPARGQYRIRKAHRRRADLISADGYGRRMPGTCGLNRRTKFSPSARGWYRRHRWPLASGTRNRSLPLGRLSFAAWTFFGGWYPFHSYLQYIWLSIYSQQTRFPGGICKTHQHFGSMGIQDAPRRKVMNELWNKGIL